jgi:hypothetical protein
MLRDSSRSCTISSSSGEGLSICFAARIAAMCALGFPGAALFRAKGAAAGVVAAFASAEAVTVAVGVVVVGGTAASEAACPSLSV